MELDTGQPDLTLTKHFSYDNIILINENIKKIQNRSFLIRLSALNSLIANAKLSRKYSTGFSAVSFELIQFSKVMESYSHTLHNSMHALLFHTTQQKKIQRTLSILQQTRTEQYRQMVENIVHNQTNIYLERYHSYSGQFTEFQTTISQVLKACKAGRFITTCSKIESAYMQEDKDFYENLANNVSKALLEIEMTTKEILKIIQKQVNL